ncbi:MAG: acetylxylan esterase [Acetanaerobacterium sp.]
MPIVDMPLKELKKYKGTNEKPKDFAAYWTKALSELDKQSMEYTLKKASFEADGVDCYHMYFTGVGGAQIHAKLVRPQKTDKPCPAVLMFHGYHVSSGDWLDKVTYAKFGFVVAALDTRGQGGLSDDPLPVTGETLEGHIVKGLDDPDPHKLFYRNAFLDTAQLARIVMGMPDVDEARVGATGFSQGGGLTLACVSLEPSVKLACTGYPFLSDYRHVWQSLDIQQSAYCEIKNYFRYRDPLHEREDEIFSKLGYIDLHNLADRIQSKVVMFTALSDDTCPPSTQFAIYNNLDCEKEMILYPDYGHEYLPKSGDIIFDLMTAEL